MCARSSHVERAPLQKVLADPGARLYVPSSMQIDTSKPMTLDAAAKALGVSIEDLRVFLASGSLRTYRCPRLHRRMVAPDALDRLVTFLPWLVSQ